MTPGIHQLIKAVVMYRMHHRFCSHPPVVSHCHLDDEDSSPLMDLVHAIHWFPEPVAEDWAERQMQGPDAVQIDSGPVSKSTMEIIGLATTTSAREFSVALEEDNDADTGLAGGSRPGVGPDPDEAPRGPDQAGS